MLHKKSLTEIHSVGGFYFIYTQEIIALIFNFVY